MVVATHCGFPRPKQEELCPLMGIPAGTDPTSPWRVEYSPTEFTLCRERPVISHSRIIDNNVKILTGRTADNGKE